MKNAKKVHTMASEVAVSFSRSDDRPCSPFGNLASCVPHSNQCYFCQHSTLSFFSKFIKINFNQSDCWQSLFIVETTFSREGLSVHKKERKTVQ